MINTLGLNCVFLFLLISPQMCLNFENKSEEYECDNVDHIIPVFEDLIYGTDEVIRAKQVNESDDDSYMEIAFITLAPNTQDDESGEDDDCDDCFPGLLTGDSYNKSKGNDKVHDEHKRDERALEKKIENKNADDQRPTPLDLSYRQKIKNLTHKIENLTQKVESFTRNGNKRIDRALAKKIENKSADDERPPNFSYKQKVENLTQKSVGDVLENRPFLRIVNGTPAQLGDAPYQVAFKMMFSRKRKEYVTFCGGVIIGPKKLLTAAHCFQNKRRALCQRSGSRTAPLKRLRETQVVAGNLRNVAKINDSGQWRKLKAMLYPFNYKFPKRDIAVGYVTKAFVFDNTVNKVPYEKKFKDHDKDVCLASGYGRISKTKSSEILLLAHLTLLSNKQCTKLHRRNMKRMICTLSVPSDTQKGDSGGPLVCSGILVGIVSGHRYGAGSFFTRVSSYSDYIGRGDAISLTYSRYVYSVIVLLLILFTV